MRDFPSPRYLPTFSPLCSRTTYFSPSLLFFVAHTDSEKRAPSIQEFLYEMKSRTEAYPGIFPRIEGLEMPSLLFPKPQVFSGFFPFSTSGVQILFCSLQLISCLSGTSPLLLPNHRTKSKIKKWMNESMRATQLPTTVVYTKWLRMIPPLNNLFLSHTLHTVSFHPKWDTESE